MKLSELARAIGIDYQGSDLEIEGLGTLKNAQSNQLSFFDNPKYLKDLRNTKAGAVIVASRYADNVPKNTIALVDEEPYLKLALVSRLFAPDPMRSEGAEPIFGDGCRIGGNVNFGKDVVIGNRVTIMPGCYIGDGVHIGDDTLLYPNVVLYHDTRIGNRCILHANTVIGSDGYGFAHTKTGEHVKLYQLGHVIVEDDVEIGSNTSIDRGAIEPTVIKKGAKLDNLVQVAHNCIVGEHSLLTGQVGLAGSTVLERNVVMGGQSGAMGHLTIGAFAQIAAKAGVTKSLPGGKVYAGFPIMEHKKWLKLNAMLSRMVTEVKNKFKKEER
ncbi:UDP-3-O-(3-hydroxymyristoyl)glucosamine N-acyltransferase [Hydrogenimonas sp.]